jgi:hypothetical protein
MKAFRLHPASDHPAAWSIQRTAQLLDFSNRVACKVARSYVERDAIFKLRYRSYVDDGLITNNSFGRYIEAADHAANSYLLGLYVDRKLISSLRIQIGSAATSNISSLELFPQFFEPFLGANKTVVDMSCVAADKALARSYRLVPYVVLRSWIIAAEHFNADYIAAAVPPQHQAFYRRALRCELHPKAGQQTHHVPSIGLITLNFAHSAKCLYENLPFLHSTPSERQQLFEHSTTPIKATGLESVVSYRGQIALKKTASAFWLLLAILTI